MKISLGKQPRKGGSYSVHLNALVCHLQIESVHTHTHTHTRGSWKRVGSLHFAEYLIGAPAVAGKHRFPPALSREMFAMSDGFVA